MSNEFIYYCTLQDNDCPEKDKCYRYMELERNKELPNTTMYKICKSDNGKYKLFMKDEEQLPSTTTKENEE